jgi:PRTRC genetic system protein B
MPSRPASTKRASICWKARRNQRSVRCSLSTMRSNVLLHCVVPAVIRGFKRSRLAKTMLAVAPFWNLSDDGRVCLGSLRCTESAAVASIEAWEQGFYESAFTHANVGRLTRHEGGHDVLWAEVGNRRRPFPTEALIRLPQTLAQFVQGR